ncbi:MAG TPA: ATP-dependent RecD-like DNA helicase [Candidatus Hydrogenedentes bacterium]|nr:ATP-dependent RecD-like DNA helicase [Candidatus Hydrogenedentota bacterium]
MEPVFPENKPQLDIEPLITLEGVVERIVYEREATGFFVGRMRTSNTHEFVTFVGNLMAVSEGETIRVTGRWVEDRKFGRQIRVETYETVVPNTVEGIERYLGSGLIEGIGPVFAKRLVEAFGAETLRVIDEEPKRLRRVPGIGKKRADQIRASWASHKAIQSIMIFLQGHGISTAQAVKIYKHYGDKAVAVLRENPYRLAYDIAGISFRGADKIASRMGLAKDSMERIKAGLLHALSEGVSDGHVFLQEEELLASASELLELPLEQLTVPLKALVAQKEAVRENDTLYLPVFHAAETGCAKLLKRLMATPYDPVSIQVENAIRWVEKKGAITLSPEQQEAVRIGVTAKVMVITGGPGTGKTTVINSILAILEKKGLSFLLTAPTGRAAKRMEGATGHDARTIHRLLEYSPKQGGFIRNETNPLETDLIVVDEMSMVDAPLMHALLQAIPPFCRLILVGDVDQLPSVGPGNVLFDIIASQTAPIVRLKTVFRQAARSGIVSNAHVINQGNYPAFNDTDFVFVKRQDSQRALDTVIELVTKRIPAKFGLDPVRDIQVLAPLRRGDAGVTRLNEALQEALNPNGTPIAKRLLRCGDKVMQLRNNYDLDVYNGDVGVITLADDEAKELEVTFEDRVVIYRYEDLDDLTLAYAATVHKAQGSEYPAVVLLFLPQHYMMLQRNVLYTAVTRGKQLAVIVGDAKAVGMAVRNSRITRRNTALTARLRNEI